MLREINNIATISNDTLFFICPSSVIRKTLSLLTKLNSSYRFTPL